MRKEKIVSWSHPVPTLLVSDCCRPDHSDAFSERNSIRGGLGHFEARDFGVLFDYMFLDTGAAVSAAAYIDPKIEVEFAFVLSDTLFAFLVMLAVALMMWRPDPPVWGCAVTGLLLAAAFFLAALLALALLHGAFDQDGCDCARHEASSTSSSSGWSYLYTWKQKSGQIHAHA